MATSRLSSQEPRIVINGVELSNAAAMTVRVALESFALEMAQHDPLGADEVGRSIAAGYRKGIDEVRRSIFAKPVGARVVLTVRQLACLLSG
jgi:hypothetical protein